ncbi:hypothetical protein HMPREF1014_01052 [Bacillus sp. 7_6_55CFAA_CT2]|nr:hypothetical protein HMPREF1014_01052 [Bacillus sp. 7_6_55CFAA_CT2]
MSNRKVPLRKCVATQEMKSKRELVRIVRSKEGEVSIDLTREKIRTRCLLVEGQGEHSSSSKEKCFGTSSKSENRRFFI